MSLQQIFEEAKEINGLLICKECIDHYNPKDRSTKYYDCKNMIQDKNGKNYGQCMCYSPAHGKRDKA